MLSQTPKRSLVLGLEAALKPAAEAGPSVSLKMLALDLRFLGAFDSLKPGRPEPMPGGVGAPMLLLDDTEDVE